MARNENPRSRGDAAPHCLRAKRAATRARELALGSASAQKMLFFGLIVAIDVAPVAAALFEDGSTAFDCG